MVRDLIVIRGEIEQVEHEIEKLAKEVVKTSFCKDGLLTKESVIPNDFPNNEYNYDYNNSAKMSVEKLYDRKGWENSVNVLKPHENAAYERSHDMYRIMLTIDVGDYADVGRFYELRQQLLKLKTEETLAQEEFNKEIRKKEIQTEKDELLAKIKQLETEETLL